MDQTVKKHRSAFARLYDEAKLLPEIRRSLNFILLANIFGNICGVICGTGTTSMVGLATSLGATDLTFGILTGIGQAAALFQIPFSLLVNRTHKRKRYILTYGIFSRSLWLLVGAIPFFVPASPEGLRIWTLLFLVGTYSCLVSVVSVSWFPWLSDICPERIRSRWLSIREQILAVAAVILSLLVAYLLDHLPAETRYLIIFLLGGTAGVLDLVCFAFVKEVYSAPPKRTPLAPMFKAFWKDRVFRRFTLMWTLWCFANNFGSVYYTPYTLNVMGLSFTQITLYGTAVSAVVTVLFVPKWGGAIYHHGSRSVMRVATVAGIFPCLAYLFSTPGSIWPTLLYNLFGAMCWTGSNLAATGMQLSLSPPETRPSYIAFFSCITAIFGTMLGSLTAGFFLDTCAARGWFTGSFDRYKLLFLTCAFLRFLVAALVVPGLTNENEGSPKTLLRAILRGRK